MSDETIINLNIKDTTDELKEEEVTPGADVPDGETRYIIERANNEPNVIIEIPTRFKLTLAGLNPSQPHSRFDGAALRIYDGTKLRSVITGVTGFRDLGMKFARKVESQTGSATWERDDIGNFKESKEVKVSHRIEAETGLDESPFA